MSISCSFPEIFAIEERSRPKSRLKSMFFSTNFFRGGPQISDLAFNIALISDHVAKFRGDRPRDRGDLAANKKRKKERNKQQQNIRAAVALSGGPDKGSPGRP